MKPQGSPRLSALKQLRDAGGELLTDCQFKCWLVAGFAWNLVEVPNFRYRIMNLSYWYYRGAGIITQ
jgi:hypothetical protein